MGDDEMYFVAARFQFEPDLRGRAGRLAPRVRQQSRRFAGEDAAMHGRVADADIFRRRCIIVLGQVVVVEAVLDPTVVTQFHFARGQPGFSQFGFGEVAPDAFDRSGQHAFNADGVRGGRDTVIVHVGVSPSFRGWPLPVVRRRDDVVGFGSGADSDAAL